VTKTETHARETYGPATYCRSWLMIPILLLTDLLVAGGSFLASFLLRKYVPSFSPLAHGLEIYLDAG